MEQKGENYTGGCLCGAVAFEVTGAPLWVAHCHCHSCRRNTGSVYATFVGLSEDQFRIRKGEPKEFVSSAGVRRGFCDGCGTPLTYRSDRFDGEVHVYVSTFDRPDAFPPRLHVHVGEAIPWAHLDDGLPRYRTTSRDGAPMQ
jgi:hypothetical protein